MEGSFSFQQLVDQQLVKLRESTGTPPALQFSPWHAAAAVLSSFDESLKPAGPAGGDGLYSLLLDAILIRDRRQRARYVLNPAVRRAVLRSLGSREAMREARRANPGEDDDPVQRVLDQWIGRGGFDAASLPQWQLGPAFEVATWLHDVIDGVPSPAAVRARLRIVELLAPFRLLVGDHFGGRQQELAKLRDYVGVLPPTSAWSWATRTLRDVRSLDEKRPLVIHGPGGMGKSTLVAKFILDHVEIDDDRRFACVYLDFDRPELVGAEPLTILLEATRQLGVLYPEMSEDAETCRRNWQAEILQRRRSTTRRFSNDLQSVVPEDVIRDRTRFLTDFVNLLDRSQFASRPLLLVLDTFEEVQYRSSAYVAETWRFLDELQHVHPRLRTVIAGRAPLAGFETENIALTGLDREAAAGFLEAHAIPRHAAAGLAGRLGGNPLTLRLALQCLQQLAAEEEVDVSTAAGRLDIDRHVDAAAIQRQLYTRILAHIHDERVQKLAHPGLVLRKVTPDAILDVLAKPCGVPVSSLDDARALLAEMGRETSLVTAVSSEELRHRPDVRRVMLRFLRDDDQQARVPQIHAAAIDFYATRFERNSSPADRAEEIYHRLALGQVDQELDARWMPLAAQFLYNAVEELDARARAWLGTRLHIELDADARASADLELWEQDAARRARETLAVGDPASALAVIHEREERSDDSPLWLIEALALEAEDDFAGARAALLSALNRAYASGNLIRRLELLDALVTIESRLGVSDALEHLREARELAERLDDRLASLRLNLSEIGLASHVMPARDLEARREAVDVIVRRLRDDLERLADDQIRADPLAARHAAAEIDGLDPALVSRVIRLIGLPAAPAELLQRLGRAIEQWDAELAREETGILRAINGVAVAKILQSSFTRDDLIMLLKDAASAIPGAFEVIQALAETFNVGSRSEYAREVRTLTDRLQRAEQLGMFVGFVERARPGVMAAVYRSTGPVAATLDLSRAPDGTLGSLIASAPPPVVAESVGRVIARFGLHPRVVEPLGDVLRYRETAARTTGTRPAKRSSHLKLTPEYLEAVRNALARIAWSPDRLDQLVLLSSGGRLASIAPPGPIPLMTEQVIRWAESRGMTANLLTAAAEIAPSDDELRDLLEDLELRPALRQGSELPSVATDSTFAAWRGRLIELEGQVCLIDVGGPVATGFLIAPEAVLTVHYAIADLPDRLRDERPVVRFGYGGGSDLRRPEETVPFAADWKIAVSEDLRFAIIRLVRKPGLEPRGGIGPQRGWVRLSESASSASAGTDAVMLYYGREGRQELSIKPHGVSGVERWLQYEAETAPGSAGAPVFDGSWTPLALHHSSRRRTFTQIREGTLLKEIVEHLRLTGNGWLVDDASAAARS